MRWIHGFPSVIATLANMALQHGLAPPPDLTHISFGSEGLTPQNSRAIHEWFSGTVVDHYGLAEGVANISQRSNGCLHVDEDFAFVEFLPTNDPEIYEIVGTNLTNEAQAFVRYRTGDLVSIVSSECACGAPGRTVKSVIGRSDDSVVGRTGRVFGLLSHPFKQTPSVRSAQILQNSPGKIDVYLIASESSVSAADRATIDEEFSRRFGDEMTIGFHFVDEVPRRGGLKQRLVHRSFELPTKDPS